MSDLNDSDEPVCRAEDIDVEAENKLVDTAGEGEDWDEQSSSDTYTLLCVKWRASGKLLYAWHGEPGPVLM